MPYIRKEHREPYEEHLKAIEYILMGLHPDDFPGELNYVISGLIARLIKRIPYNYQSFSMITGVLDDVKTEFNRRVKAPYEDEKIKHNGDVYWKD